MLYCENATSDNELRKLKKAREESEDGTQRYMFYLLLSKPWQVHTRYQWVRFVSKERRVNRLFPAAECLSNEYLFLLNVAFISWSIKSLSESQRKESKRASFEKRNTCWTHLHDGIHDVNCACVWTFPKDKNIVFKIICAIHNSKCFLTKDEVELTSK